MTTQDREALDIQEPLPCPFCGSKNVKAFAYEAFLGGEPDAYSQCQDCSVTGPNGKTAAEASAAWNRRAERTGAVAPEGLHKIGELLRTQDNRITDQPLFIVQQKRSYVGAEGYNSTDEGGGRIEWRDTEEYCAASASKAHELECSYQQTFTEPDGWKRFAMFDVWEFVTACFTEQGCKDYLAVNGHNLNEPRIYAEGSYRNDEYRTVRNWLMSLAAAPSAPEPAAAPDDPMDWKLPCDVKVGAGTHRKGTTLRSLVSRMEMLHGMAMKAHPVDEAKAAEFRAKLDQLCPPAPAPTPWLETDEGKAAIAAAEAEAEAYASLPAAAPSEPVALARRFHETYERLAPQFGYETRSDTRSFDPQSANGKLMIAVCAELATPPAALAAPQRPAHETIVLEGDLLTCTACGVSAQSSHVMPPAAAPASQLDASGAVLTEARVNQLALDHCLAVEVVKGTALRLFDLEHQQRFARAIAAEVAGGDGWISVDDERKPDIGQQIILFVRTVMYGETDDGQPYESHGHEVEMGEYRKYGELEPQFECFSSPMSDNDWITHWQPLPPAPARKEQAE